VFVERGKWRIRTQFRSALSKAARTATRQGGAEPAGGGFRSAAAGTPRHRQL